MNFLRWTLAYVNSICDGIFVCCYFGAESNVRLVEVLLKHKKQVIYPDPTKRKITQVPNKATNRGSIKKIANLLFTLQISSPRNPPAAIKLSLTAIVLICTLETV